MEAGRWERGSPCFHPGETFPSCGRTQTASGREHGALPRPPRSRGVPGASSPWFRGVPACPRVPLSLADRAWAALGPRSIRGSQRSQRPRGSAQGPGRPPRPEILTSLPLICCSHALPAPSLIPGCAHTQRPLPLLSPLAQGTPALGWALSPCCAPTALGTPRLGPRGEQQAPAAAWAASLSHKSPRSCPDLSQSCLGP